MPEPGNPQALNRYSYVLNNPLRYTDPSGHLAEGDRQRADDILDYLASYDIDVDVDWGYYMMGNGMEWIAGLWEIGDLETIAIVVARFAFLSGGQEATRQAIGGVMFQKIPGGGGHVAPLKCIQLGADTFQQSGIDLHTQWGGFVRVAHELAHYWDWKTGSRLFESGSLVAGLPTAVGSEPGPTWWARISNPDEDWAESVAGYMFPVYFDYLAQENPAGREVQLVKNHPLNIPYNLPALGPYHYAYVRAQFKALQVTP